MMNTKATTVRLQSDADKQCETMGSQTEADAKYRVRGWAPSSESRALQARRVAQQGKSKSRAYYENQPAMKNTRIKIYKLIHCYKAKSLNLTKQIEITAILLFRKNLITREKFSKNYAISKSETAGCYTLPVRYVYRVNETDL